MDKEYFKALINYFNDIEKGRKIDDMEDFLDMLSLKHPEVSANEALKTKNLIAKGMSIKKILPLLLGKVRSIVIGGEREQANAANPYIGNNDGLAEAINFGITRNKGLGFSFAVLFSPNKNMEIKQGYTSEYISSFPEAARRDILTKSGFVYRIKGKLDLKSLKFLIFRYIKNRKNRIRYFKIV